MSLLPQIYLSRAPGDVRDYDGSGDWFKVYQLGTRQPFNGTDEGWATWKMKNWQFRLPAEIPAGEYLMRIEQMSVHPPYRQKEWYVQCAHLKINSNYNGPAPGPTIKIPGGYKISDPAIQYDQWAQPPPTYAPMPGPPLWPNNNPQQGNPNQGGNNGGGNQGGGNGGCTVPKWYVEFFTIIMRCSVGLVLTPRTGANAVVRATAGAGTASLARHAVPRTTGTRSACKVWTPKRSIWEVSSQAYNGPLRFRFTVLPG
jgi:hypothetical protein